MWSLLLHASLPPRPFPLTMFTFSVRGFARCNIQNPVVSSEGSFVEDLPRGALGYHFVLRDIYNCPVVSALKFFLEVKNNLLVFELLD